VAHALACRLGLQPKVLQSELKLGHELHHLDLGRSLMVAAPKRRLAMSYGAATVRERPTEAVFAMVGSKGLILVSPALGGGPC